MLPLDVIITYHQSAMGKSQIQLGAAGHQYVSAQAVRAAAHRMKRQMSRDLIFLNV